MTKVRAKIRDWVVWRRLLSRLIPYSISSSCNLWKHLLNWSWDLECTFVFKVFGHNIPGETFSPPSQARRFCFTSSDLVFFHLQSSNLSSPRKPSRVAEVHANSLTAHILFIFDMKVAMGLNHLFWPTACADCGTRSTAWPLWLECKVWGRIRGQSCRPL